MVCTWCVQNTVVVMYMVGVVRVVVVVCGSMYMVGVVRVVVVVCGSM
jgi:hypothetical protein